MLVHDLLLRYARFSQWAHKRLLDTILTLNTEQQHATVSSSFDSLYKTVYHIWGAEILWLGRLSLEPVKIAEDPFYGNMGDLSKALKRADEKWVDWFAGKTDARLTEVLHYSNKAGQPFNQPLDELLMHIFNHNTYHNGQLVTMLRALGVEKIPSTDFIAWTRLESGKS